MEPYQVLVVEDQEDIVAYCRRHLAEGFAYQPVRNGRQAEQCLAEREFDLVLLDKNFSHLPSDELLGPPHQVAREGIEILKKIKSLDANLPVIMITGFGDEESVSAAFRLGAFDYIEAEVLTKDELILKRKMENAIAGFSARTRELVEKYSRFGLVGKSPAMVELYKQIEEASNAEATVLLLGEPGVGKDLVARAIYRGSDRSAGPFIACDMTQTSLIESSLFGIAPKSATGVDARRGFFEMANGGVLFLNEIGELPLDLQSKLLVSLEDREYYPIGSTNKVQFDARIIAATNRDLAKAIETGHFRRDLYGRLNQRRITVPPLSRRKADIPLLIRHFTDHYCAKHELPPLEITDKAMKHLESLDWPGNVRELKYAVERLVTACDGVISIKETAALTQHFTPPPGPPTPSVSTGTSGQTLDFGHRSLSDIEREMVIYYLKRFNGYVKPAHETMGISRAKFYDRIAHYNLKHLVRGYNPQD